MFVALEVNGCLVNDDITIYRVVILTDALEYLIDAAFIASTMGSAEIQDHYDAFDYLQWAATNYGKSLL